MGGDWWIAFMVIGEFAGVAAMIWIVAHYRSKRLQQNSEARLHVLERLGTGKELMEYLDTEKGEKILRFFAAPAPNPYRGLGLGAGAGLLSISLGMGFMILSWIDVFDEAEAFLIPGVLCLFGGAGVLGAVAFGYRLARLRRNEAQNDLFGSGNEG